VEDVNVPNDQDKSLYPEVAQPAGLVLLSRYFQLVAKGIMVVVVLSISILIPIPPLFVVDPAGGASPVPGDPLPIPLVEMILFETYTIFPLTDGLEYLGVKGLITWAMAERPIARQQDISSVSFFFIGIRSLKHF